MGLFTKLSSMLPSWESNGVGSISCRAMNNSNAILQLQQLKYENEIVTVLTYIPSNAQALLNQHRFQHGDTVQIGIRLGSSRHGDMKITCGVMMNVPHVKQGSFCLLPFPEDTYEIMYTIYEKQIVTLLNDNFPMSNFEQACKKSNMRVLNFGEGCILYLL